MRCADSYQSIKGPDELEEESRYESILQSLLEEYDPDEGDFKAYQNWCRKHNKNVSMFTLEMHRELEGGE